MVLGNFKNRDVLLILIIVGQGPTVILQVERVGFIWTFFFSSIFLSSSFLFLVDGSIQPEMLSQRAITTNQQKITCASE